MLICNPTFGPCTLRTANCDTRARSLIFLLLWLLLRIQSQSFSSQSSRWNNEYGNISFDFSITGEEQQRHCRLSSWHSCYDYILNHLNIWICPSIQTIPTYPFLLLSNVRPAASGWCQMQQRFPPCVVCGLYQQGCLRMDPFNVYSLSN